MTKLSNSSETIATTIPVNKFTINLPVALPCVRGNIIIISIMAERITKSINATVANNGFSEITFCREP